MRLSGLDGGPGPVEPRAARPPGFEAALREAEARRAGQGTERRAQEAASRREREGASRRERQDCARRERPLGQAQARRGSPAELRAADGRRGAGGPEPAAWGASDGLAGAPAAPGQPPAAGRGAAPTPGAAVSLALAVRAAVPAVEAFRRSGREALALDFGPALGLELRAHAGGVDLVLAAAPGLAAAARAELPALVRALAARGVTVVRAGVRPRGAAEGRGR